MSETLADLARLAHHLRVSESESGETLELASIWRRLSDDAPLRWGGWLMLALLLLVLALVIQAALARQPFAGFAAAVVLAASALAAWRVRHWFWQSRVVLDAENLTLAWRGWSAPAARIVPLVAIERLSYRMADNALSQLQVEAGDRVLALPFTGERELDRLYCNLLRHLLQRRNPAIVFQRLD